MNSKAGSPKRAGPLRKADFTKAFAKDWARYQLAGRTNLSRVKLGMLAIIANDGPMGPEWSDHALTGDWRDHREFHAGGDLLVIYLMDRDSVVFVRLGTHAELFE